MNNKLNDISDISDRFYSLGQISNTRFFGCIAHKLSIVCAFFLLATINVASANDDKFSIGLNLSKNQIDNGFKLDLGYSINDIFSVELSYFKLGDDNMYFPQFLAIPDNPQAIERRMDAWDASLLAKHKINKFSVYARLGWFMSNTEQQIIGYTPDLDQQSSYRDSKLSYGLGAGFDINKQFSINLDHTISKVDHLQIKITSLGFKYRF